MKASLQLNEIEQLEFYSKSQMDKGQFIPKINTYYLCFEILYNIIFIYFQAAVSALLAVSVLYVGKKNQNKYYVIF